METVAVVASIVAIFRISDRVISACKFYMQATSDTPSDLRAILVEVSTLKTVLETAVPTDLFPCCGQPSLIELMLVLEVSLNGFDIAYIVIDALDESKPREDLLRVIRDFATDSRFVKVHCIVTSRKYIDIEQSIEPISCSIVMSNVLVEDDVRKHVHSALHAWSRFQRWPTDLLTEVKDAVIHGSKGIHAFLGSHYFISFCLHP
jgi:hypothetical protein